MAILVVAFLAPTGCRVQELRFVYPVPPPTDFTQRKNLVYKQTNHTALALDLFLPARSTSQKPLPALVIFNVLARHRWLAFPTAEN
jgi:hypothetical protein